MTVSLLIAAIAVLSLLIAGHLIHAYKPRVLLIGRRHFYAFSATVCITTISATSWAASLLSNINQLA